MARTASPSCQTKRVASPLPRNPESSSLAFKPYLDNVQKALDNQYLPEFRAVPGKKSGLQYVRLSTEVAGVELVSADSDWVKAK